MMKCLPLNKQRFLWIAFFSLILILSCSDDNVFVSDDLPEELILIDSLTVNAYTVREDSVNSKNFSKNLLGSYYDPVFGRTEAAIITQIALNDSISYDFGNNPQADSFYIDLKFDESFYLYGQSNQTQEFKVYKLAQNLNTENQYYSNFEVVHESEAIGTWLGIVNADDKFLRIYLDNDLANEILNADSSVFFNNSNFFNFFKGIYIKPVDDWVTPLSGSIFRFDLLDSLSQMVIHYDQGKKINFLINSNCIRIASYDHNYLNTPVNQQLKTTALYDQVYIQPMGGVKVNIKIPYIKELAKKGSYVVHQAKIVLPYKTDINEETFFLPSGRIILTGNDDMNRNMEIRDMFEYDPNYGGYLNTSDKQYSFLINRYINSLLRAYEADPDFVDHGLNIIVPSDNPVQANRVVLNVNDNETATIKIYLKLSGISKE